MWPRQRVACWVPHEPGRESAGASPRAIAEAPATPAARRDAGSARRRGGQSGGGEPQLRAEPRGGAVVGRLSHLNDKGEARMVDVSAKTITQRSARAEGFVAMAPATLALVETGTAKKGDVLATARLAGIMAAKKTHELIPLCHPLAITGASVDFQASREPCGLYVTAEVKVAGQTGVEMEALTAVSIACLTIYDMLKAADKTMTLSGIRLIEKTGGRSGNFRAERRSER